MTIQEILDYIAKTPENANVNVLSGMLDELTSGGGGGGGSMEYESGTISHSTSFEDLVIPFKNTHTKAPDFFVVAREDLTTASAGLYVFTVTNFNSILGTGEYVSGNYHVDGIATRITKTGSGAPSATGIILTTDAATKVSNFCTKDGITISDSHGSVIGDFSWFALWIS